MSRLDAVIVGGGIIGLTVGWKAAAAGLRVVVCDPAPGRGASWAAAGMLAPVTEATAEESELTRVGLASLTRWPRFAADLAADAGVDVELRQDGTLQVAFDGDDRRALDELLAVHRRLGLDSQWRASRQCRELEPLLSPRIRGGLFAPGDWQIDPRVVVTALIRAFANRGGRLCRSSARRLHFDARNSVGGVELAGGQVLAAGAVVIAAGAHSAVLGGLPPEATPPVRPIKGEILRLRADPEDLPFTRTIRGTARGRSVYLVARSSGEVVVGATMQEAGFDTTVRSGAVHDLLHAAIDLVPAIEELPIEETLAALRPGTPDNAPVLGPSSTPGLLFATGHHRNGVLLAPFTADAMLEVLTTGALPAEAASLGAGRFR